MALLAGLRELCRNMIWICGALIVLKVAAYTSDAREVVVVVEVTVGAQARGNRVPSAQRKSHRSVIEFRV